jgi:hypothetical protein
MEDRTGSGVDLRDNRFERRVSDRDQNSRRLVREIRIAHRFDARADECGSPAGVFDGAAGDKGNRLALSMQKPPQRLSDAASARDADGAARKIVRILQLSV